MENDKTFPPDRERLEYIEQTIKEHSAYADVDVQRIVVSAMDAYWNPRIKESIDKNLEIRMARFLRLAAQSIYNPRADIINGLAGVFAPSLAYLGILYWLVSQRGDWETPIPRKFIFLAVIVPVALAITLVFVSGPRSEYKANPLGVLRDSVASFMTRVPIGAAFVGSLLTAVATWTLFYSADAQRETRTVSFNSAKTILVDKSLSTMKDLQANPNTQVAETTQEFKLSETNVMSLTAKTASQKIGVKYVIEDQGAFPGQLSADIEAGSGTISWMDESRSEVVQTQMYVCRVNHVSDGKVFVDALGGSAENNNVVEGAGRPSDNGSAGQTSEHNGVVVNFINLTVNGETFDLTAKPELFSSLDLSRGQNLILIFDIKTRVASRIEPMHVVASARAPSLFK